MEQAGQLRRIAALPRPLSPPSSQSRGCWWLTDRSLRCSFPLAPEPVPFVAQFALPLTSIASYRSRLYDLL
jgi:hypothetical protein